MDKKESERLQTELVAAANSQNGKLTEVFTAYYKHHYRDFLIYILWRNQMRNEDAEDILSVGFQVLYANLLKGGFEGRSEINTYFKGILKNLIKGFFEGKKKGYWKVLTDFMTELLDYYLENRESDRWITVEENMQYLTAKCQKILKLYYFEGYRFKEIASQLSYASADAARTTKKRCMQVLADRISQQNA